MMLPSNIYLHFKIMFYDLTGKGGQGEKSSKKKRQEESPKLFLHIKWRLEQIAKALSSQEGSTSIPSDR